MMAAETQTPEEILARIPQWRGKTFDIAPQGGGKTNPNYLVTVDGEKYVLRISSGNTEILGINRQTEHDAALAVSRAGIAPEVIAFLLPEGHLVTRFIWGKEWSGDEFKQPEVSERVVPILKRIHALPPIAGHFQPFRDIAARLAVARQREIELPESLPAILQKTAEIEAVRNAALNGSLTLCHNDPWHNNFLYTETDTYLLDWEFAGMGDPFFDLASVAAVYSDDQKQVFLQNYFGETSRALTETLEQMIFVVVMWNCTWALLQIGVTYTTEDYVGMAKGMFGFLEARL